MSYQFERTLAFHTAPTLARIKAANLISCRKSEFPDLILQVASANQHFNRKGIYFRILAERETFYLVLVYHQSLLEKQLLNQDTQEFLSLYGYGSTLEAMLLFLEKRLEAIEFPHEIGLFLGYPLADVKSFIEHEGRDYLACGCWKVYHDLEAALQRFEQFKRCSREFMIRLQRGMHLENMI